MFYIRNETSRFELEVVRVANEYPIKWIKNVNG